ncbi:MAG TPA: ATP-binding cassette domain-containing protein [Opitutaceae bacterium]|jgi:ABC-2 type transport system ATP-binding protein|nr:ATP-binding cassette domain-containing protein [Opitutaceae bacterium]MBP8961312.1 ATP-binding cassette domain-containing protein [Opitutaceae bacterium]HOF08508.1 ATP-binding cassette domain-containing protein [Opitutaceae bacterium]HOR23813.1 ATP-binding cassette domain-containing protein [Opitutaceae bacterium]HOY53577.1 ATP-binding cassette domain-containing protein [Opitutaceae bacterium]
MIEVEHLTRVFRTYKKQPGFWGGVKGLFHRQFDEVAAANDISFSINEGEFVGFLGPNGAGKTTTLKMLSGLIYPTSGRARVAGHDPSQRATAYRRLFALVLGQKNQLWWDLPAIESFHLLRHIYGLDAADYRKTLDELVDLLGVREKLSTQVRELSLGERMKMELIAALLHRPRVLFLDEPTIGLDVVSQRAVRQFLRDYNRRYRVTILLTSHYMADIKELCERVIVIHRGRKIYDGDLSRLDTPGSQGKIIRFAPSGSGFPADWRPLSGTATRDAEGNFTVHVHSAQVVAVSQQILAAGPVADITIEDVPLEDIIAELFTAAR